MLFWVTTRGRDKIFNSQRDPAMASRASIRKLLLAFTIWKPLVGLVTGRFENNGICEPVVPELVPETMYCGLGTIPLPAVVGVVPTLWSPPMAVCPLPQPIPS